MDEFVSPDAQRRWAALPIPQRLRILGRARALIASDPGQFLAEGGGLSRKPAAEALSSEIMPLLAGIRFLEQEAEQLLAPRTPGRRGLPLWMQTVTSEVRRVPFGTVLIIGPSNYPLFLPGLQAVQALVAGNAVVWKPGTGGGEVARTFARILRSAGLPNGLLALTEESVAAAERALAGPIDKVFLTGSAASGRAVLHRLAERLIPSVMELSGCDAVVVLPGAEVGRVVQALAFGTRLNGSRTCMAPRRLLLVGMEPAQKEALVRQLLDAFGSIAPVPLGDATRRKLHDMLEEARAGGALVYGAGGDASGSNGTGPVLVDRGQPGMAIAQADIFAPVLTLIEVSTVEELLEAQAECPFGLTASLFGPEASCRDLAERLDVGSVFINDLIFPSADPRMPFGGRRMSGFGVTQGAEGLLEMAAIQTISVQRSKHPLHYAGATSDQAGILTGLIRAIYGRGLAPRVRSLLAMIRSARASR